MAEHTTEDLVLVSYLEMNGVGTTLSLGDDGDANWTVAVDHRTAGLLMTYAEGDALVEPRAYSRAYGRARARMFDFLNRQASAL